MNPMYGNMPCNFILTSVAELLKSALPKNSVFLTRVHVLEPPTKLKSQQR